jgi:MerR family transcriptional regulator, light-induced transcriptional regulator
MTQNHPSDQNEASLNIGAVERMTGIPVATLHAWERRYGFPHAPVRTAGGHRLYSMRDVNLLQQVKLEMGRGLSTRQAVAAVMGRTRSTGEAPDKHSQAAVSPGTSEIFDEMRRELGRVLEAHDLNKADELIGNNLVFASPEEIILQVIGPVLSDLGEAWVQGRISVQDEHLASNYLRQRLLTWLMAAPPPREIAPLLLACAPGEWHEGGLLMLAVLLRRRGWPVEYLGQNVPFKDLAHFIDQINPSALILVAMLEKTALELVKWQDWVKQVGGRPLVTFGGRAFVIQPELKKAVPGGIYLGDDIRSGLIRLEGLLK